MRALLLILDGFGCGNAPDASDYGDFGADTLRHVLQATPGLRLPNLWSLGLGRILGDNAPAGAAWGSMIERSAGKDSTTGHWELAGVILDEPFAVFEKFPPEIVGQLEDVCGTQFLGNVAASGTAIIELLGEEHLKSGRPILYTSADSVIQIAAHEQIISVARLHEMCGAARAVADRHRIGRVIARPFVGEPGSFKRTAQRHDFSMTPPRTVLNALCENGVPVIGIGKVADLFAGSGFTDSIPTLCNRDGMAAIEKVWSETGRGLLFANLVDFDSLFGHRRDVAGFAGALREFDDWLGRFLPLVVGDDMLIISADHGNDPTVPGSDHTRETVPLLVVDKFGPRELGVRSTFTDVAATLARCFIMEAWPVGAPFAPPAQRN